MSQLSLLSVQIRPGLASMANCATHWERRPHRGWSRKGSGESNLFTLRLHQARDLRCLRNTRVRLLKGWKEKGEGEKDPSKGQEEKPFTLSGKDGLAGSHGALDPHQGVTSVSSPRGTRVGPQRESPEKILENLGKVLSWQSLPLRANKCGVT